MIVKNRKIPTKITTKTKKCQGNNVHASQIFSHDVFLLIQSQ